MIALSLGETLRAAREAQKESIRGLARKARISSAYLCDIELDRRCPREEVLGTLAKLLRLHLQELLSLSGRIGSEAEAYITTHPTACTLIRRLAALDVSERELQKMLAKLSPVGVPGGS